MSWEPPLTPFEVEHLEMFADQLIASGDTRRQLAGGALMALLVGVMEDDRTLEHVANVATAAALNGIERREKQQ